jgi:hypothetical protein
VQATSDETPPASEETPTRPALAAVGISAQPRPPISGSGLPSGLDDRESVVEESVDGGAVTLVAGIDRAEKVVDQTGRRIPRLGHGRGLRP